MFTCIPVYVEKSSVDASNVFQNIFDDLGRPIQHLFYVCLEHLNAVLEYWCAEAKRVVEIRHH